jgi:hypothetical protein
MLIYGTPYPLSHDEFSSPTIAAPNPKPEFDNFGWTSEFNKSCSLMYYICVNEHFQSLIWSLVTLGFYTLACICEFSFIIFDILIFNYSQVFFLLKYRLYYLDTILSDIHPFLNGKNAIVSNYVGVILLMKFTF